MLVAKDTLEANLRGVIAELTPEEINQKKVVFQQKLIEEADRDLMRLGLVLDNLQIQNISDDVGYLTSVGRVRGAAVRRDAAIGEVRARASALVQKAQNTGAAEIAKIDADLQVARKENERRIVEAKTKREAVIAEVRGQVLAQVAEARAQLKAWDARIEQVRRKLEADVVAPADAKRQQAEAQAKAGASQVVAQGRAAAIGGHGAGGGVQGVRRARARRAAPPEARPGVRAAHRHAQGHQGGPPRGPRVEQQRRQREQRRRHAHRGQRAGAGRDGRRPRRRGAREARAERGQRVVASRSWGGPRRGRVVYLAAMPPRPDLDAMGLFVRIVDHGSLSAAGRALGLPKATLSRRLVELERSLGSALLRRSTRAQSLTPAGRALYDRVAPLLVEAERAASDLRSASEEPAGLVRVSAAAGFGQLVLMPISSRFLAEVPKVRVELSLTDDLVRIVDAGFDLAFRMGALAHSDLVSRRLARIERKVVASPAYLAARGAPRAVEDLKRHATLVGDPGHDTWQFDGEDGPLDVRVAWQLSAGGMMGLLEAPRPPRPG